MPQYTLLLRIDEGAWKKLSPEEMQKKVERYIAWAAIAATYTSARCSEEIDWASILEHYDQLVEMTGSPIAALNRTVTVMKLRGAEASLDTLKPLQESTILQKYHLLHAVHGHMLAALGRWDEAGAAFSAALECECSQPEKRFLQRQLKMTLMRKIQSAG